MTRALGTALLAVTVALGALGTPRADGVLGRDDPLRPIRDLIAPTPAPSPTAAPTAGPTPTASPSPSTSPPPVDGLGASYELVSMWATGYEAAFHIANAGPSTIDGWRLEFDLPSGQVMTSHWNGVAAMQGQHYVVTNQHWNGELPAGAGATFGYVASFAGTYAPPQNCAINSRPCNGAAPTTVPSPTPTARPTAPPTALPSPQPPPDDADAWNFAPYADVTLWPPIDLAATKQQSGVKYFSLAFVVTGREPCRAAWGGVIPVGDDDIDERVADLRAAGGDVVVSFGGANGHELALTCPTFDALALEYQRVIDRYQATRIDFDIEGAATGDMASVIRRSQAIAKLQRDASAAGRTLVVSLTLPVLPSGLTHDGVNVVRTARDNGVRVDVVNIMAMDYGPANAPNRNGHMGEYAIEAMQSSHRQLAALYGDRTSDEVWAMIGVTPMIGQNDVQGEVFDLEDARQVTDYATQVRPGRLSMWSVGRDQQCVEGIKPVADPKCSGILQEKWAFSRAFDRYPGRT